jgi:hypothetical protein
MTRSMTAFALIVCLGGSATVASAQGSPWTKGTALGVFGGGASQSTGTDGAAGMSIGWELTPFFTIEGSGTWMDGKEVSSFAALIGSRVNLLPRRAVVPFLSGGVGMQITSVDGNAADVPAFYRRRLSFATPTATPLTQTFDDFLFSAGGGIDIFINHHVALRPDVRVMMAVADGTVRPTTVYGLHLAYHFEEHAVTPLRIK